MASTADTGGSWRLRAACRGRGSDLFFPTTRAIPDEAAALCASCEVRQECADFAEDNAMCGIWAGERLDDDRSAGDLLGLRGRTRRRA